MFPIFCLNFFVFFFKQLDGVPSLVNLLGNRTLFCSPAKCLLPFLRDEPFLIEITRNHKQSSQHVHPVPPNEIATQHLDGAFP